MKRLVVTTIVLVVTTFFVRVLARSWSSVQPSLHTLDWKWVGVVFLGFSVFYLFRVLAWQRILRVLGYPLPFSTSGRILLLSEITRYVPGNVWSILGRIGLSRDVGVPADRGFFATVVEVLATLTSAMFLGGILALAAPQLPLWTKVILGFGVILIVCVAFGIRHVGSLVNWVLAKFNRQRVTWEISPKVFLRLFCFYFIAWVGFSIGGYASAAALVSIPQNATIAILAAMPLSWFIGYMSFITPSGLGFREAAIVAMLNPIVGVSAVILAASSRLAITIMELLWVGVFAWGNVRRALQWVWHWLRTPRAIVIISIFIFAVYFSILSVLMNQKLHTARFDLGNMDQVVWNTSHGRIFQATDPYGTEIQSRAAYHTDFILILFAPFYWIYSSANVLLVAQAFIFALGAWFVYRLAKRTLGHEWLAVTLALSYLFYPALHRAVLFDFHGLTLAATFGVAMILYAIERRWVKFALFAFLFILSKEELSLIVASVGVLLVLRDRKVWRWGLGITLVAGMIFVLTYFVVMPAARVGNQNFYEGLYDTVGTSPGDILQTIINRPVYVLSLVAGEQARAMYINNFGSLGFLSLASPLWLALAWPEFIVNLFSNRLEPRQIFFHYQAVIGGFTFVSAIFGIAAIRGRIGGWWANHQRARYSVSFETVCIVFLIIAGGIQTYRLSPLPYAELADNRATTARPRAPMMRAALAKAPEYASVSATNTLGAQLAHRERLYQFPLGIGEADYIFILEAAKGTLEWERNHVQVKSLTTDTRYELIQRVETFSVYRKR